MIEFIILVVMVTIMNGPVNSILNVGNGKMAN